MLVYSNFLKSLSVLSFACAKESTKEKHRRIEVINHPPQNSFYDSALESCCNGGLLRCHRRINRNFPGAVIRFQRIKALMYTSSKLRFKTCSLSCPEIGLQICKL